MEILKSDDPRVSSPDMEAAAQTEVEELGRRGPREKMERSSLAPDANVLGTRFLYAIKKLNNPAEGPETRFIGQGNGDKAKPFIVHNLSILRKSSTKIILSTSAVLGFRIYSHDVNQAYLHSKDQLTREIYIRPKARDFKYFGLVDTEALRLRKPRHGIPDAGDYWDVTVADHVKIDPGMSSLTSDTALFVKEVVNGQEGMLGGCVDDFLKGGNETFQDLTLRTLENFGAKPREWETMNSIGVSIKTVLGPGRTFKIDQLSYIEAATTLQLDTDCDTFVPARAAFVWIAHCRPDLVCAINRAARVTVFSFLARRIKEINKAIKYATVTKTLVLSYPPLEQDSLHLRVYADAAFASNDEICRRWAKTFFCATATPIFMY